MIGILTDILICSIIHKARAACMKLNLRLLYEVATKLKIRCNAGRYGGVVKYRIVIMSVLGRVISRDSSKQLNKIHSYSSCSVL